MKPENYQSFFKENGFRLIVLEGTLGLELTMAENILSLTHHAKNLIVVGEDELKEAMVTEFDVDQKRFSLEYKPKDESKVLNFGYQTILVLGDKVDVKTRE